MGTHANSVIIYDVPKGAKFFKASVGLASTSKAKGKVQFIVSKSTHSIAGTNNSKEGPHAKPNPQILLPHVAVKALIDLNAVEACLEVIDGPYSRGALWALKMIHDEKAVEGLINKYRSASSEKSRPGILATLIRLYQIEAPYDGSWWWSTRPDTRGPYYKPIKWEASEKIANSAYLTREQIGNGQLILFSGQPNFRGSTRGTSRLWLNAVVYGAGLGTTPRINL